MDLPTSEDAQQALSALKVLVIDRLPSARDALRSTLGRLGITAVQDAGKANEALRKVKIDRFDIVFSGFILDDGRDGQQLLEELRHAHLIPLSTVYIIVTGERDYNNVVSLAELAPDDYLIKPFTPDLLHARLLKALDKKRALREIYEQIENGNLWEALAACDWVAQQHAAFRYDALRFKAELLQRLGRNGEAEEVYRRVLAGRTAPWAKMGLAATLKERGAFDEAQELAEQVTREAPHYLAAYDFLASVHEAQGRLTEATQALQHATRVSPNNTARQRMVGDIASRNKDLLTAEKAYGKVLERHRDSSLKSVDDFANLSRVMIERGDTDSSRKLLADMKRNWRGDKYAEMAGMVMESLCLQVEGRNEKAQQLVEQALAISVEVEAVSGKPASQRLSVDLAQACLASGKHDEAQQIMRRVAGENNEDAHVIEHIASVYEKTGQAKAGKALLDQISAEIVELNNRGVMAAHAGDYEGSVKMLIEAAEQVPNLQFLVNAAKAIFTLIDRRGWDGELAKLGLSYLKRAEQKDAKSPKVASARDLYTQLARKYPLDSGF